MVTIHKYTIEVKRGPQRLVLPAFCEILSVQVQGLELRFWAMVDTDAPERERTFEVYGTGWEIARHEGLQHRGTVQIGGLVWHVFERHDPFARKEVA